MKTAVRTTVKTAVRIAAKTAAKTAAKIAAKITVKIAVKTAAKIAVKITVKIVVMITATVINLTFLQSCSSPEDQLETSNEWELLCVYLLSLWWQFIFINTLIFFILIRDQLMSSSSADVCWKSFSQIISRCI